MNTEYIVVLVAVGNTHVNEILEYYRELKSNQTIIKILTDQPSNFDLNDVILYQKSVFNYFDKIFFSLKIVEECQKSVIYVDGSTPISKDSFDRLMEQLTTNFLYVNNWPKGDFFEYKDEICFRFLLEYMNYRNISLKNYPTISEQIMVFNKTINYQLIKKELEIIQPVFDYISVMNDMTYSKPFVLGGAEGLALSIIMNNNDITHKKINL
jgi:hypothetical protein